jgi:hypothetical protein
MHLCLRLGEYVILALRLACVGNGRKGYFYKVVIDRMWGSFEINDFYMVRRSMWVRIGNVSVWVFGMWVEIICRKVI